LNLSGTAITDARLAHLAGLPKIRIIETFRDRRDRRWHLGPASVRPPARVVLGDDDDDHEPPL